VIIASPYWRQRAGGSLLDEISHRISYPYTDTGDAIEHWSAADSWRPPSTPMTTYSPAQVKGILPPFNKTRVKRHEKSALWFSRNRRAGSALLRHNHIRPVITRHWRPDCERIEGAIWHSKRIDSDFQAETARESRPGQIPPRTPRHE
jgi:hypothetical protein